MPAYSASELSNLLAKCHLAKEANVSAVLSCREAEIVLLLNEDFACCDTERIAAQAVVRNLYETSNA